MRNTFLSLTFYGAARAALSTTLNDTCIYAAISLMAVFLVMNYRLDDIKD